MTKKDDACRFMNKKKYEFDEKKRDLEKAKEEYRKALVEETIEEVLVILKEEGTLTERDLQIFLGDLSLQTKHLYDK